MSSYAPARPAPCGIDGCRSRKFHVDNGLTYCRRGHLQEGLITQEQDYEDINWSASQTTRIRDGRRRAEREQQLEALGGPKGLELFLHAFQLILRKNAEKLMEEKRIEEPGGKFEEILRDLWGLRVQILDDKGFKMGVRERRKGRGRKRKVEKKADGRRFEDEDGDGMEDEDEDEDEDDGENGNPTDTEAETDPETDPEAVVRNKTKGGIKIGKSTQPLRSLPKLLETIALPYIAALFCKLPLRLSVLQQWAQKEELYYHNAIDAIPFDMRTSMAAGYQTALQPLTYLGEGELHKCVADLMSMLEERFPTLIVPSFNYKPVLLDYLLQLGLPFIYSTVNEMAHLLRPGFTTAGADEPGSRHLVSELGELQVVGLIVVSAKLLYPFHGEPIFARSASDPAMLSLDWEAWARIHTQLDGEYGAKMKRCKELTASQQLNIEPDQVWDVDDEQLDAYMDWFEDMYTVKDIKAPANKQEGEKVVAETGLRSLVYKSFPLQPHQSRLAENAARVDALESERNEKVLEAMQAAYGVRDVVSESALGKRIKAVPRTGTADVQYRRVDQLESNAKAKAFYSRVAKIAGIPLKTLLGVVNAIEDRVDAEGERQTQAEEEMDVDVGV